MSTTNKQKNRIPKAALQLRKADPFYEQELARYPQPMPSRGYLLQILTERGAPMLPEELVALFAVQPEESEFFNRRLAAMAREGEIVINRKGAICIPDKLDLIRGRVHGHADGYGFLVPEDGSADLFLGPREMHKVLHKDRVLVREVGVDRRGRREGKIVEVLEHMTSRLVGRLQVERGVRFVRAEDKRITQEILVSPEGSLDAEAGQVVMLELVTQPSKYGQPIGRIIEVLGNYADPGMEIEIALRKHDLPHVFSDEAEAQAAATSPKVRKKDWKTPEGLERVDLRDLPLVTIDGETARDFDDAVFAEPDGKGWRLVVAIADVSHYVRPGDALDQTAFERGNSVYFPRRVIPMLPEALSNGICSLNPDVERCCMVCDIRLGAKGKVKKYKFYPAVMRSHARFTYNEVWDILQQPKGQAAKARKKLVPGLQHLYTLFQLLAGQRKQRGAIDFETTETRMVFDDAGKIARIEPVTRNDAHRLIEECMLAANVCAADYLGEHQHTSLYRIHEGPTERKLENLRRFLNLHGLSLGGGDEPTTKDYAELMDTIKQRPDVELLQTMMLRSMQQAVYSPERSGHFGLAYDAYTHFTSPIRRYPDLLVHRCIKAVLKGKTYKPGKWEEIGAQCSMTERRADEATRDVENWLKCYYMRDRIGEVFEGVVSAVTNFGLFVTLKALHVEGLVHISELGADYFQYDDASHSLRGERTGKTYGLTDKLTIQVARVDLETSKIDFVLANRDTSDGVGKPENRRADQGGGRRRDRKAAASAATTSPVETTATPLADQAEPPAPSATPKRARRPRKPAKPPMAADRAANPQPPASTPAPPRQPRRKPKA
ncbi:ribonuclease R [Chitinimonas sp. BJYL2]|uniref:ribonuclease R n=1 Tax=Chitinimonas sp. BJYL2 TaxID=2976696 RepID=UPI0027E3CA25|nr:ribonuclease R [Chitinimonas sp. BJYL2]